MKKRNKEVIKEPIINIYQDEHSIACDIARLLKGITYERFKDVLMFLETFDKDFFTLDFKEWGKQNRPKG